MFGERPIRTSLEVGFPEGGLPEKLIRYRGKDSRCIPVSVEFPYEDAQFEVVMLEGAAVNSATVREAHRVLRPEGHLFFIVPEQTHKQCGFTMPDIYSIVRDGFNIVGLERPPWWRFGACGHTLFITACKKAWKSHKKLDCSNLRVHSLFSGSK